MDLTWLGQGGFLLEEAGYRLVVDPYFSDAVERVEGLTRLMPPPFPAEALRPDYWVCTHAHMDHYDGLLVQEVMAKMPRCLLIGPEGVRKAAEKDGIAPRRILELNAGGRFQAGPFTLKALYAEHGKPAAIALEIVCGARRLYLSGDTLCSDAFFRSAPEGVDWMILCINGLLGNMSDLEALRVVAAKKPRRASPMHYGMFKENTADPARFLAGCAEYGIEAVELTAGKCKKGVWNE